MGMLNDDVRKQQAHIKAEEMSQLRKKRLELVARKRHHQDDVKIDTIKTFLALGGNLVLTAGATGISYQTLKYWKASNWWNTVITELRKAEKLELSANTKKILNKSLALLEDRLDKGDFIYDQKKGKLIRKPVPAASLHKIAVDMMERKDVLDKATSEENINESNDSKLIKLAEQFAALAAKAIEKQKNLPSANVVDVESREV
jgi:hypothetical protein